MENTKISTNAASRQTSSTNTMMPQSIIMSATTASAVGTQIEQVPQRLAPNTQLAKTNITSTAARVNYPRHPQAREGQRYFQCPCCCQVLPELFRQETHWKKHLMADVCPYTCILQECPTPESMYIHQSDWLKHVREGHAQCWECIPCKSPGRVPLVFPSVGDLITHIKDHHNDTIDENQHQTLIESAVAPTPTGLSSCPLCDETGAADSEPLLDHILEHVHEFSLRSLPWPADKIEDVENQERDYFDNNDYFGEASQDQSRQYNVSDGSDRSSDGLASLPSNGSFVANPDSDVAETVPPLEFPNGLRSDTIKNAKMFSSRECTLPEVISGPVLVTINETRQCPDVWHSNYIPFQHSKPGDPRYTTFLDPRVAEWVDPDLSREKETLYFARRRVRKPVSEGPFSEHPNDSNASDIVIT
ncbi:hypothetical protein BJ166DRAFT_82212 [Pestalotiopsis sp. NC0098]|nr:hypothetical protein BJ166DRAFT_82212 [Pestalotiopsis sp. NC0098]